MPEEQHSSLDCRPDEIVELRRGRRVRIRPLAPTDERALNDAFTQLSARSRQLRFGYVTQSLSAAARRQLVHTVDGRDHVAFVAFQEESPHRMVGVARILRYPHDRQTLDVAITVADSFQDDGLGRALAVRLAEHRPRPASRLVTQVAPGNHRIITLLSVFGQPRTTGVAGEIAIELDPSELSPSESVTGSSRVTTEVRTLRAPGSRR